MEGSQKFQLVQFCWHNSAAILGRIVVTKVAWAAVQYYTLQIGSALPNSLYLNVPIVGWVMVLHLVNLRLKICMAGYTNSE